ncbi:MAG: hypothetical protein AABZ55_05855 [Bdellovibrionota bacterium]
MSKRILISAICALVILPPGNAFSFFGTELGPLLQLVSGQITEIEKLSETVGLARDQMTAIKKLNEGIDRALFQIQNIKSIIERAQGLDPSSIRSLSDINDLLSRAKQTKEQVLDMLLAKVSLANVAIATSALQSDTAYKMGQEMVVTGSQLSNESQVASPGRATQITAAADSAQMLASGVELQTLAQMVQLQAMTLEFQKSQIEQDARSAKLRDAVFEGQLSQGLAQSKKRGPR